ncbi:MAG: dicarboxylate/amino acid:cation symporter [Aliarcobacter sp.]|nr:dicarboxylate/amino acid:cation symporter [Aliarcobacter sp.]MDD2887720.1 dicarboxylate/amino acid:cation symporter [Aliarcobacter sp.]
MKTIWRGIPLWQKIVGALILGLLTGIIFGESAQVLKPIGTLFLNLIKMLIVPLVFVTLVTGIIAMEDLKKMRRVGLKTFFIYLLTTAIAITIGLIVGIVLEPGVGVSLETAAKTSVKEAPALVDTLLNIITKNPFSSFASGDILQIIFFAIILGISINLAGEKGKPAKDFFNSMSEAMYKMTEIVMEFAPFGVFGLMAWVSSSYGMDVLLSLGKVIIGVYIASLIHMVFVLGGGIYFFAKLNPIKFFKGIIPAQTVAFTTTSSSGTLPVTTQNAIENLGVSKPIASFVLPLGATINMDGTAIYQGLCAMFVAQAFGIQLGMQEYMMIILTATLASIGTAGVPGAGLIMLTLVLTSVGLPIEGVAIIAGIDRILDMARTTVNITGDAMTSVLIAKSENELDEDIYNGHKEYEEYYGELKPEPVVIS